MPLIFPCACWTPVARNRRHKGIWQGLVLCLLAFALIFCAVPPVLAQSGDGVSGSAEKPAAASQQPGSVANSQAVDTQALAALILILENPTLRQHLLRFIKQQVPGQPNPDAAAATSGAGAAAVPGQDAVDPTDLPESPVLESEASVVKIAIETVQGWLRKLFLFLNNAVDFGRLGKWLHVQASSDELSGFWIDFLSVTAIILLVSTTVYGFLVRMLRRLPFINPHVSEHHSWVRGRFLAKQLAALAVGVAGFWAVAYLLMVFLPVPSRTYDVVLNLLAAVGTSLVLASLLRIFLHPRLPSYRLVKMRGAVAVDLFYWLRGLVYWVVLGRAFFVSVNDLFVPTGVFEGLARLWGLATIIISITLVLRYRSDITDFITARDGRFVLLRRFLSRIWLPALFVYAIGSYVIWALDIPGASILVARGTLLTVIIMFLVQPVAFALERWLDRAETSTFGIGSVVVQQRLHRYARLAGRFAKAVVYTLAAFSIATAWELQPIALLNEYLSGRVSDVAGEFLLILAICLGVWEVFDLILSIYMEAKDDVTGKLVQRSARTRTLVPLLRTIMIAFLLIAFAAATLNSLGLDIAPLLATAGIVGIAIGFGAQKLVQDVITGLFMLFQDTISVGDIVELGGNVGTVQRITIRTIELRDLEGNLYTIPFSSVDTVKNMSREFAFAQIDVGIAYRENADHVMEVLKHLGAELECDPSFGPNIVGSIEVMGVHELGDSAVTIRCRFKVLPQTQFGVRRAFLGLIKRRFDELGIEIPFPQRTLHWAGPFEQPPFSTGTGTSSDTSPEKA